MMNQKGFSIAQVMVAMTIMSIMSVGLSTMIQNQSNTVFYLEDQMSHQNLKKEVETLLSDTTACTESLSGIRVPAQLVSVAPNAANDFVIKDNAGVAKYNYTNNNLNKFDKLEISHIHLQNVDIAGAAVDGIVNIMVDVRRDRGPSRSQALKSILIQKEVTIDAGRNVTGCSNIGADALGVGDCLVNKGGANLGRYLNRSTGQMLGANSTRIPASAKAMRVVLPGDSCSGGSSSGGSLDSNTWSSTVSSINATVILNGKSKVNGVKISAGGTLSVRNTNQLYYNNILVSTLGSCGHPSFNRQSTFTLPQVGLPLCTNTTDFPQNTSMGIQYRGNSTTPPFSVSYWE